MKRSILRDLYSWKDSANRKPLILLGARQVGKTWILKEFGRLEFSNVYLFDFSEKNTILSSIFKETSNPHQIIKELSLFIEKRIDPSEDLIIFDEIQAEPVALKSLKYFYEKLPQLNLVCAGSLLGVGLSIESFPVGKVDYLDMYPMSFQEFLEANASELLIDEYYSALQHKVTSEILHMKLMDFLRDYLVTGGMPEVVSEFRSNKVDKFSGFSSARKIQVNLVKDYQNDFGKHAGKVNAVHIRTVFDNVPLQLASNVDGSIKKYQFKDVLPGKKGFEPLEGPISWLEHAGLLYKVPICNHAGIPLKAYTKNNFFKLHLFDIGILGTMLELSPGTVIRNDYGTAKGYFMESFVMGELKKSINTGIYSWTERNSEIEFIINQFEKIIPIEVKSGKRTKAKSLAQYLIKYNPDLAVKFADVPLAPKGKGPVWNIPLYFAGKLTELLEAVI